MSGIDRSFWHPVPLQAIPPLAHLRDVVLTYSVKRMPRWRFRLASDFVVQLQPKPSILLTEYSLSRGHVQHTLDFDGCVWAAPDLTRKDLERRPADIRFAVYATEPAVWHLQAYRAFGASFAVRDRLAVALSPTAFDDLPAVMFSPQCLICSRTLRDPASLARFIGPECFGSSSLTVPRLIEASA